MLASVSPQRRAILSQLGVTFDAVPPEVEEATRGEPRRLVVENARRKARAVAARCGPDATVLGVDTAVVLGNRVYGKPRDADEARSFLEALSGRGHEVWSGLALLDPPPAPGTEAPRPRVRAVVTEVRFRPLRGADVEWYIASGEWVGRAGGYAIQGRGAALVEGIVGDYWNVVGLPVAELIRIEPGLIGR